jgi:small multidrug resistance pump
MSWTWLILAIICEVSATLSLRASDGFRRRLWLVPAAVGYIVAFSCLALSLKMGMQVGVAYGVWTATGVALVAILARAIWKDPLTKKTTLGIALIAAGVLLVETGTGH